MTTTTAQMIQTNPPQTTAPAGGAVVKQRKKKERVIVARGKRKEAIARASIREGLGRLRFNGQLVSSIDNQLIREIVSDSLKFFDTSKLDIDVIVNGGGMAGQAQAARTAVAKGLVAWSKDAKLRQQMLQYDRSLLVEDPRRVEPKKFKGPKARARFTKSYR
ncbi:MAG TPA: 30S ribosomal protein S9 [Candidatus Norongarragalinales archaeon]|jgi:small subunit ribosomal protein S9|nr:30S ribosomal protein S9 [Candidatus Norongarragalinales archaeon]